MPLPLEEGVSTVVAAVDASVATVVMAPTTAVMVRTGRLEEAAIADTAPEEEEEGAVGSWSS